MAKKHRNTDGSETVATSTDKPQETKNERFRRLARIRVKNAAGQLNNLARLANKANYDYSPEEAARVVNRIEQEYQNLIAAFNGTGAVPADDLFAEKGDQ